MFQLTPHPIDTAVLKKNLMSSRAGAFSCFEGWVRDYNNDRAVQSLEYEAHLPLCENEMQNIFQEVKDKFDVIGFDCVHRTGHLQIGDLAVWVGVVAAHRDDAFRASRYIIDEVKCRLPIWKKEHYTAGTSEWIDCTAQAKDQSIQESDYYARQINLKAVGYSGQEMLKQARVLVVGAGGLGSSVLLNLAGAGVGTIGICEYDVLQTSNLHRQTLYSSYDIGKNKIDLAADRITALNPFINVVKHDYAVNVENILDLIKDYEYICDCTDNFKSKFIVHDASYFLNKILIQSSIYQYEGQLSVFTPDHPGCLRCVWPVVPEAGCVGTCTEAGVLGPLPSVFGALQANETIKLILNLGNDLSGKTMFYDMLSHSQKIIANQQNESCPLCGVQQEMTSMNSEHYNSNTADVINVSDLAGYSLKQCVFMDIREPLEISMKDVKNFPVEYCPLSRFDEIGFEFDQSKQYIIYCAAGVRSLDLVRRLKNKGITNVVSLNEGINGVIDFINTIETRS